MYIRQGTYEKVSYPDYRRQVVRLISKRKNKADPNLTREYFGYGPDGERSPRERTYELSWPITLDSDQVRSNYFG
jgi:hypothetical protein